MYGRGCSKYRPEFGPALGRRRATSIATALRFGCGLDLGLQLLEQGFAQEGFDVDFLCDADVGDELHKVGVVLYRAVFAK